MLSLIKKMSLLSSASGELERTALIDVDGDTILLDGPLRVIGPTEIDGPLRLDGALYVDNIHSSNLTELEERLDDKIDREAFYDGVDSVYDVMDSLGDDMQQKLFNLHHRTRIWRTA